jgi:hypothetical protein
MGDLRFSRVWDRQLESDLPDCRLSYSERTTVMRGNLPMQMVYCANCGIPHGLATMETTHVFFVCDPCFNRLGAIPGAVQIPDPATTE